MNQSKVWAGIDLGQRRCHICVIDQDGAELLHQECATSLESVSDALAPFGTQRIALIAVEAGNDTHLVRKLRGAGFPVTIFEARKASKFLALRRNKTDASDARGLADLGRLGANTVSRVHLKSVDCEQLRGLVVMRNRLVMMRLAAESSLRSRLALNGRRLKSTYDVAGVRREANAQLALLLAEDGIDLRSDLEPLIDLCESLRMHLRKLDREVEVRAKANEVCRLLMGVPGVGPICALSFYTAIEDPHRFRKASDIAPYLGLAPRRHQSGGLSRTLGIMKSGSKLTRTHLVTAATVFGNTAPDCELKRWFIALRSRAGSKRARIALARKLAIILLTMWKRRAQFEPRGHFKPNDESVGGYEGLKS